MGEQPESVAKDFDSALGSAAAKFMTIARTANMDAYRSSQAAFFKANKDIVSGWQWMASLSFGTCPACLAMNGKFFRDDEKMETHWSCRCIPIPILKGFESEPMQSGEDWLKSQPEDIQRKVLGPGKYDLWRQGKISLQDMVAHSHHDSKGWMYHEATISQALENAVKSGGGVSQIEYDSRISDSVKSHVQGDLGKQIDHTFDAIESVHEPIVSRNKYDLIRAPGIKDNGYFDKAKKEIGIRPDGEHVELTVAHELGHQLHIEGFTGTPTSAGYPSLESEELKGLKQALDGSKSIQELRDLKDTGVYYKRNGDILTETVINLSSAKKVNTYLSDHEQFSRAYAQYIAQKSGNKTMIAQVNEINQYGDYHRFSQWNEKDFSPIAKAFDVILKRKGLL
jgi:SPP1 gp7 family putative phage head morphogenesis protein